MSEATNQDRPSAQVLAGQLRQVLAHDEPTEVIEAYRAELSARRMEKSLAKALSKAPPLSPGQIANIRAVLDGYDPDADGE